MTVPTPIHETLGAFTSWSLSGGMPFTVDRNGDSNAIAPDGSSDLATISSIFAGASATAKTLAFDIEIPASISATEFIGFQRNASSAAENVLDLFLQSASGGLFNSRWWSSASDSTVSQCNINQFEAGINRVYLVAGSGVSGIYVGQPTVDPAEVVYTVENTDVGGGYTGPPAGAVADSTFGNIENGSLYSDTKVSLVRAWNVALSLAEMAEENSSLNASSGDPQDGAVPDMANPMVTKMIDVML